MNNNVELRKHIDFLMSDPTMSSEAALINIHNARKYFEKLENPNNTSASSKLKIEAVVQKNKYIQPTSMLKYFRTRQFLK